MNALVKVDKAAAGGGGFHGDSIGILAGAPDVTLECTPMAITRRLGKTPYKWQDETMRDVMPKFSQTALLAANESGKTTIILVGVIMWALMVFTNSTVVVTSGSWRQVKDQVFAALQARADAFPGFVFLENEIIGPDGNRCIGFSTDDAGKFEGWHAVDHDESPLMIIVDEAKSVSDEIFTAIDRCHPTRLLVMSSPGPASGAFYRAHTTESAGWKHHKVTAYDCPHIPLQQIEQMIAKYGVDNPLVRSMIFAEWMMNGDTEKFVIPWAILNKAYDKPPAPNNEGEREYFCDFAVSPKGDECCLAERKGNKVRIVDAWKGSGDTVREAHRFVTWFGKLGLNPSEASLIGGDVSGLGQGFCDVLATMGWNIRRVNNQSPAAQPARYANLGTETWFEALTLIQSGQMILPEDEKLKMQLTARQYYVTLKGQLILMSKDDQPGPSPDRADAVLGCMRGFSRQVTVSDMFQADGFRGVAALMEEMKPETDLGNSWMSSTI